MRPVKVADSEKKRKHLVDESEASKIGELVNQQIDSLETFKVMNMGSLNQMSLYVIFSIMI